MTNVYTIGFTGKSAKSFFTLLKNNNIKKMVDVRLNKTSQLSGFAKQDDLIFFLSEITKIEYIELADLTPEKNMLKDYQNKLISWDEYEQRYLSLLEKRNVEKKLDIDLFENGCLLCSEDKPHQCHRRLAIEYLNKNWNNKLSVSHLF